MNDRGLLRFFFNPLKNKVMVTIATLHLLFVYFFHRIFGEAFFLAPDERGYLQVAKDVYSNDYDYVQWGWPWRSPVWFLRLIYSPFKVLIEIGIPDLIAFRLSTMLYSLLAVYFVLAIYYFHNSSNLISRMHKFGLLSLFLPTFFLWTSLGLRESFLYFSFASIGAGILLLTRSRHGVGFFLMTIGCIFLAYTKDYMYLIFLVSLLITIFVKVILKQLPIKRVLVYLVALAAPIAITPSISLSLQGQFKDIVFGEEAPRSNLAGNSTGGEIGAWGTERGLAENCENNSSVKIILKLVKPSDKIQADEACINQKKDETLQSPNGDGNSEEEPVLLTGTEVGWESSRAARLSLEPAHISDPREILSQLLKIAVLPIPLVDNGSSILNIVAWESPIWLFLILITYLTVISTYIRTRKLSELNLWSALFVFGILLSSALTEINVGTMVRHRSLVLVLCLFVILTTDSEIYRRMSLRNLALNLRGKGKGIF
jgi:hypothetical protein